MVTLKTKLGAKVEFEFVERGQFGSACPGSEDKYYEIARHASGTFHGISGGGMAVVKIAWWGTELLTLPIAVRVVRGKIKRVKPNKKAKKFLRKALG